MIPGENRKNLSLLKLVESKRGEVNQKIYWWKYFDASTYFVLSRREGSNSSQTAFINHYDPMSQFWAILALVSKPASFDEPSAIQSSCSCDEELANLNIKEVLHNSRAFGEFKIGIWFPRTILAHTRCLETMGCRHVIVILDLRTCNFWSSQRPDHFHNAFFFNECPEVN